jgi:hypothetical protein
LVFGVLLAACTGATYHAAISGYEVHSPPAFLSANSHDENHLEQTKLGIPIDLAVTHFGGTRDVLFGGGETYLAIAVHGAFQLPLDDATLAAVDQGFTQSVAPFGLTVADRQKLEPTPLAVGEELTFAPAPNASVKRSVHVRLFVATHSVYFVLQAVDADVGVFTSRRRAFFDGFHVTPTADIANAPALPPDKLTMIGQMLGETLAKRNVE